MRDQALWVWKKTTPLNQIFHFLRTERVNVGSLHYRYQARFSETFYVTFSTFYYNYVWLSSSAWPLLFKMQIAPHNHFSFTECSSYTGTAKQLLVRSSVSCACTKPTACNFLPHIWIYWEDKRCWVEIETRQSFLYSSQDLRSARCQTYSEVSLL